MLSYMYDSGIQVYEVDAQSQFTRVSFTVTMLLNKFNLWMTVAFLRTPILTRESTVIINFSLKSLWHPFKQFIRVDIDFNVVIL